MTKSFNRMESNISAASVRISRYASLCFKKKKRTEKHNIMFDCYHLKQAQTQLECKHYLYYQTQTQPLGHTRPGPIQTSTI